MRAPASGREAIVDAEPDGVYVDRETGEELEPVTRTLPLAPSSSALLRTPENLRACRALRPADRPRRQRLPLLRPAPAGLRRRRPALYVVRPVEDPGLLYVQP